MSSVLIVDRAIYRSEYEELIGTVRNSVLECVTARSMVVKKMNAGLSVGYSGMVCRSAYALIWTTHMCKLLSSAFKGRLKLSEEV